MRDYELGEFGFPDDEYNYRQHFRAIGGAGGVFMDAVTGMPDPGAVRGERNVKGNKAFKKQPVIFKDSFAEEDVEDSLPDWRKPEDDINRQKAIDQLKKDSRFNQDLADVLVALDSEHELDSDIPETEEDDLDSLGDGATEEDTESEFIGLADDFITMANEDTVTETEETEKSTEALLEGIVDAYREPRLLDEQFDSFMRGFDLDSTDEEIEEYRSDLLEKARDDDSFEPQFGGDFESGLDADELASEFEGLLVDGKGVNGAPEQSVENDGTEADDEMDEEDGDSSSRQTREKEYEQYTAAEFESGLTRMMDSMARVDVDTAITAIEGLNVARDAIARQEEEEKTKIDMQNELGLEESDGHDSELETLFDEMYENKGEKWDCETIVSTYSNTDNHPSVIDAPASSKRRSIRVQPIIRLDPRTQAPADYLAKLERKQEKEVNYGTRREKGSGVRKKGETKEEKRARKNLVKEAARERRALKSEMKRAFGTEQLKQDKHATAIGNSKVAVQF